MIRKTLQALGVVVGVVLLMSLVGSLNSPHGGGHANWFLYLRFTAASVWQSANEHILAILVAVLCVVVVAGFFVRNVFPPKDVEGRGGSD